MTRDEMDWLREQYQLCKDQDGETPNLEDFCKAITERMKSQHPPFRMEDAQNFQTLILKAFREMELVDLMNSEIDEKSRHAETNAHNRKYVDGSF